MVAAMMSSSERPIQSSAGANTSSSIDFSVLWYSCEGNQMRHATVNA